MQKLLLLMITALLISSCNDKDDPADCCTIIDTALSIKYVNESGENIYTIDNLSENGITVYHMIEGEWENYVGADLGAYKGIKVYEREGEVYLQLYPSPHLFGDNISETKIEFSEEDVAVIKTQFDVSNNNTLCTKVWYNDELAWEVGAGAGERILEIVK